MRNKIIFIALALLVFAASAVIGHFGPNYLRHIKQQKTNEAFDPPAMPDTVVADFSRQFSKLMEATEPMRLPDAVFLDLDGRKTRFSDFAGKPTLVNFWATWCAPCVVELPSLAKLAQYYDGRMNVVGVALEIGKTPQDIAGFLEKRLLGDFAGYVDLDGKLAADLQILGLPTSFLIDSDGIILYRFEGDADWSAESSRAFFDSFLLQKR